MNKQELRKHIEVLPYTEGPIADTITINRNWILKSIEQLDEPQKVVVPQFVADWYEENKDNFDYKVWECVFHDGKGEKTEMSEWINRTENAFITLVNMHQFGFEVEKEKRYLVKLKNNSEYVDYLVDTKENGFRFYSNIYTKRREHTRKELEAAGFGWVFDCPGIEIEEVI